MLSTSQLNSNVDWQNVHNFHRWAIRFSEFNFIITHISNEDYTWTDLLTKWTCDQVSTLPVRHSSLLQVPKLTKDVPKVLTVKCLLEAHVREPLPRNSGFDTQQYKELRNLWKESESQFYISNKEQIMPLDTGVGERHDLAKTRQLGSLSTNCSGKDFY